MHSHPAPTPTSKTLSYPPYTPRIPRRQVQRNLFHAGVFHSMLNVNMDLPTVVKSEKQEIFYFAE